MKTNGLANPANPGNKKIQPCPANPGNKQKLSDNAFYLIALATLLQESMEPRTLQHLLVPGKFAGYGKPGSHQPEKC